MKHHLDFSRKWYKHGVRKVVEQPYVFCLGPYLSYDGFVTTAIPLQSQTFLNYVPFTAYTSMYLYTTGRFPKLCHELFQGMITLRKRGLPLAALDALDTLLYVWVLCENGQHFCKFSWHLYAKKFAPIAQTSSLPERKIFPSRLLLFWKIEALPKNRKWLAAFEVERLADFYILNDKQ